jgi:hypothetical protein
VISVEINTFFERKKMKIYLVSFSFQLLLSCYEPSTIRFSPHKQVLSVEMRPKILIFFKKNQKSNTKNQKSKTKNQIPKIKNQKSKIKNQKSKIKNQKSKIKNQK